MIIRGVIKIAGGLFLLIIGIIGLLVPLLPGLPFIILALILFIPNRHEKIQKWLKRKTTGK
jgi:uncharacterized membrane protein YbaN (DUF454 family)